MPSQCPYKREVEGDSTNGGESSVAVGQRLEQGAPSQGLPAAPEDGNGRKDSLRELLEGAWPCPHRDFSPRKLVLNFWPPEL